MSEQKMVPFNQIDVPDELNARTSLDHIEELAESIKTHGLLQPLVVKNGGPEDKPYTLIGGFRRAHALKTLKWGKKEIPVTVVEGDDALINLVENVQREELHPAELAQRLHDLNVGDYVAAPGATPAVYDKKFLAEQLGITISHVNNLIRAHTNLCSTVRKAWKPKAVPTRFIFQLAAMPEEEQEKAFAVWLKGQEILAETGKKRGKAESEGEGEGESEGGKAAEAGPQKPNKRALAEQIVKLDEMLTESKGHVAERLKAQRDTLRWVIGELSRFPSAK